MPKVWGMATMSGPDLNQQRLECGGLLNISGVIRSAGRPFLAVAAEGSSGCCAAHRPLQRSSRIRVA